MSRKVTMQQKRRELRRQLGLCWDCTERALPRGMRCSYHTTANTRDSTKRREKAQKTRGWRLTRVPV